MELHLLGLNLYWHVHHWHIGTLVSSVGSIATAGGLLLTRQTLISGDARGVTVVPATRNGKLAARLTNAASGPIWDVTFIVRDPTRVALRRKIKERLYDVVPQAKTQDFLLATAPGIQLEEPLRIALDFTDSHGRRWRRRRKHGRLIRRHWWTVRF